MFYVSRRFFIVAASLACGCAWGLPVSFSATSPSGRNEIRLDTEPALSYSVFADGVERFSKAQMFLRVNGRGDLGAPCRAVAVKKKSLSGRLETPIYKKASIDLAANETFVEFEGGWGVRLIARDDGVAYRFETQFGEGSVKVLGERMVLTFAPSCKSVLSTVAYNEVYKGDPFQHSGEGIPVRTAPDAVFAPSGRKGKNVYSPIVAEYSDGVNVDRDATDYSHRREVFKAGGRLVVSLAPSGGYVARIERRRVSAAAARGKGAVGTAVRIHRICVN